MLGATSVSAGGVHMGCTVELALPPRISLPYQSRSDVAPSRSDRARPAVGSRLDCRPEATGAHAAAFLQLVWCWPHPGFAGTEARFLARMITKLLSSRLPCPDHSSDAVDTLLAARSSGGMPLATSKLHAVARSGDE